MRRTLLLVDDSVTIQRVIALIFADEDVEVVTVSDGDQAVRSIEASPPDIVLADIGMPGLNGYDVARHVKQSPRLAHIPVVLLAGAFEPADEEKIAASGCDGVLGKPFEPQEVIARVRELLSRSDRHEQLDQYFDRLDQDLASLASAGPQPMPDSRTWFEPSAPAVGPSAVEPASPAPPPAEPPALEASMPATVRALPPLADAFAALLAAEEKASAAGTRPAVSAWRAAPADRPFVDEDLIEQVTARVLERLSDRVVRDAADDIISRIAERLVREEIERIKSSIK